MPLYLGTTCIEKVAALQGGAAEPSLSKIVVRTAPIKTDYVVGDLIDTTGMVISVYIGDSMIVNTTEGWTIEPTTALSGTTAFTVIYTLNGITKTATQAIAVSDYSTTFNDNSWEIITKFAALGRAKEIWTLGDTKSITIGGVDYDLQILDFDHYTLSATDEKYGNASYNGGTNKAAICLGLKDTLNTKYKYCNGYYAPNWHNSTLYTTLNNTIMPQFPEALLSTIRLVSVDTYSSDTTYKTDDKIICPSSYEILGKNSSYRTKYANKEGTHYAYYAAGNSPKRNYNGTASLYYTRSTHYSDDWRQGTCVITTAGTNTNSQAGSTASPITFVINI